MAKGEKYDALKHFLQNHGNPHIVLTFDEIAKILGFQLPASAIKYSEVWWANDYSHSQAIAWIDAGYETEAVSDTYSEKYIVFEKRR